MRMLTTVNGEMQPHLTGARLTCVDMTALSDRLAEVMRERKLSQSELATIAGVSRAAVTKWIKGDSKAISAARARRIEERTAYRAIWLETGALPKFVERVGVAEPASAYGFEQRHIDLLRMYLRLPDDDRHAIRRMIEVMSVSGDPEYQAWEAKIARFNAERDAKTERQRKAAK